MRLSSGEVTVVCATIVGIPAIVAALAGMRNGRTLRKETSNNGGSSMRDAIDRIEEKQDELSRKLAGHVRWSAADSKETWDVLKAHGIDRRKRR